MLPSLFLELLSVSHQLLAHHGGFCPVRALLELEKSGRMQVCCRRRVFHSKFLPVGARMPVRAMQMLLGAIEMFRREIRLRRRCGEKARGNVAAS